MARVRTFVARSAFGEVACLLPGGKGVAANLGQRAIAIARWEELANGIGQIRRPERVAR